MPEIPETNMSLMSARRLRLVWCQRKKTDTDEKAIKIYTQTLLTLTLYNDRLTLTQVTYYQGWESEHLTTGINKPTPPRSGSTSFFFLFLVVVIGMQYD